MNRIKNELFSAIDGVDSGSSQVVVIGATNHPENIDPAMRRRFTKVSVIISKCDLFISSSIKYLHICQSKARQTT